MILYSRDQLESIKFFLLNRIKNDISGFQIKSKKDSVVCKILSFFLFFIPNFMNITTVFFSKIWFPYLPYPDKYLKEENNLIEEIVILCHEYRHLLDRKKYGILFDIMYVFPQILGIFSLLSFFNIWFLLCLLFFLPIPSPTRTYFEIRGYTTSMSVRFWLDESSPNIEYGYVEKFTGFSYYYAFPFKKYLTNYFENYYNKIVSNEIIEDKDLQKIKDIIVS